MKLVRAFIRPESEQDVVWGLDGAGFSSITKLHVSGRGKQKGVTVGNIQYDAIPKLMLAIVVNDQDVTTVKDIIIDKAKTGNIGDGKIFISPVEEAYTIRTGEREL